MNHTVVAHIWESPALNNASYDGFKGKVLPLPLPFHSPFTALPSSCTAVRCPSVVLSAFHCPFTVMSLPFHYRSNASHAAFVSWR